MVICIWVMVMLIANPANNMTNRTNRVDPIILRMLNENISAIAAQIKSKLGNTNEEAKQKALELVRKMELLKQEINTNLSSTQPEETLWITEMMDILKKFY